MLEGGLHAEDQVVAGLTQIDEAPVHALVESAVGGDGCLGVGCRGDLESVDLDLDTSELDAFVVLEFPGGGEEGAGRESRAGLRQRKRRVRRIVGILGKFAGRGIDQLDGAWLIAQDDELHLLLVAHRLDPSGNGDGARGQLLQLVHQDAFTHERPVYGPVRPEPPAP